MPATTPAFLSVRLPAATRNQLKIAAATRGESVQTLIGTLVDRFLAEQPAPPPGLPAILATLRARAPALKQHGMRHLFVFGSVARGEARPDSDIDLFAEFNARPPLSLVRLASLRADLSDLLGAQADLVERRALHPAVRDNAERDAVQVF